MEKRVYGYKCGECGFINYPYRMRCGKCGKTSYMDFEQVPLPGRGKLLTFTFVYNLPGDFEVPKLGIGIVELENGVRVTGQIEIEEPEMGMDVIGRVEVVRKADYDKFYGFVFRSA